jgi:hypothetical protein
MNLNGKIRVAWLEGQVLVSLTQELVRDIANILKIVLDTIKRYIISEREVDDKSSSKQQLYTGSYN